MSMRAVIIVKRGLDLLFGSLFILLFSPVMLIIAIAVKLTSPGNVLYKQKRAGALKSSGTDCPEFYVYKFRTMVKNAENGTGAVLSKKGDCRVTKIGAFLRKTRLDELPQFLNVIKGDMSIVGPRPERPELMAPLSLSVPFFEERLRYVKPGITGLAQVKLQYNGDIMPDSELSRLKSSLVNPFNVEELNESVADGMRLKLLYDLVYATTLERFSTFIRTDLSIMIKTPIVMFYNKTGQ